MLQWIAKHRRSSLIAGLLILYFTALTAISHRGATVHFEVVSGAESLLAYEDFSVTAGEGLAHVASDALVFQGSDSGAKVFSAPLNLRELEQIQVSFSVDCPDENAGTVLHIDLYADGYDSEEQEFTAVLHSGSNTVAGALNKGKTAPESALLRIFTLDPADYAVRELQVDGMILKTSRSAPTIVFICILLLLVLLLYHRLKAGGSSAELL